MSFDKGEILLSGIFKKIRVIDEGKLKTTFEGDIFDLADDFLRLYESVDYPIFIYECSLEVIPLKIGCLFDILIWSSKDNGAKLIKKTREWLYENNKRKIEIALSMSNIYPLSDFKKLEGLLKWIKKEFPDLANHCEYWKKRISEKK